MTTIPRRRWLQGAGALALSPTLAMAAETAMYDYLVAHGVPAEDVVRDHAGRDTYDSCSRARRIFGVDPLGGGAGLHRAQHGAGGGADRSWPDRAGAAR